MTTNEYKDLLAKALPAGRRVLAVGKPGVGKTEGATQVARELGWDIEVSVLPLDDPSTIRGYPFRGENGKAEHLLFDGVHRVFHATRPTLWFLDDIGQASEATLKAVMRVIQFGELDGRKLPDCVCIAGATNDVGHGAGVYGMIEPLKSRFHTLINVEASVDDVVIYGLAKGWPSWLLAFLRNSPDALNDWKPSKSMSIDGACPRGWDNLAGWDLMGVDDTQVWAGCVGKGRAVAASAYKRLAVEQPDIAQVFGDPDAAPVPNDPAAKWLVSCAIAANLDGNNFGKAIRYLNRMSGLFRAFAIRDGYRAEVARRKDGTLRAGFKSISQSREFAAWCMTEEGKTIVGLGGKV